MKSTQIDRAQERVSMLIPAEIASAMCGLSVRTWRRLDATGKVPRAIVIGGRIRRWNRAEVESWIEAGCPKRREWESRDAEESA